mgnify:CR=1 FL=1
MTIPPNRFLQRRQFMTMSSMAGMGALLPNFSFAADQKTNFLKANPPKIFLVTWRGMTDVERGFMAYWKSQGINPIYIHRDGALKIDNLIAIKKEIMDTQPDLVHTWGTQTTTTMVGHFDKPDPIIGNRIPLVFTAVTDPIASNIVKTLTNHGRNLAGLSHTAPLLTQLIAINSYQPIKTLGVIYDKTALNSKIFVGLLQNVAKEQNFKLALAPYPLHPNGTVNASEEINAQLVDQIARDGANWLYFGPDTLIFTQHVSLSKLATAKKILTFAAVETLISPASQTLMGLVSDFDQLGMLAAFKGRELLSGRTNIAVEYLEHYQLLVKVATAKALGVFPPLSLLNKAQLQ